MPPPDGTLGPSAGRCPGPARRPHHRRAHRHPTRPRRQDSRGHRTIQGLLWPGRLPGAGPGRRQGRLPGSLPGPGLLCQADRRRVLIPGKHQRPVDRVDRRSLRPAASRRRQHPPCPATAGVAGRDAGGIEGRIRSTRNLARVRASRSRVHLHGEVLSAVHREAVARGCPRDRPAVRMGDSTDPHRPVDPDPRARPLHSQRPPPQRIGGRSRTGRAGHQAAADVRCAGHRDHDPGLCLTGRPHHGLLEGQGPGRHPDSQCRIPGPG